MIWGLPKLEMKCMMTVKYLMFTVDLSLPKKGVNECKVQWTISLVIDLLIVVNQPFVNCLKQTYFGFQEMAYSSWCSQAVNH